MSRIPKKSERNKQVVNVTYLVQGVHRTAVAAWKLSLRLHLAHGDKRVFHHCEYKLELMHLISSFTFVVELPCCVIFVDFQHNIHSLVTYHAFFYI